LLDFAPSPKTQADKDKSPSRIIIPTDLSTTDQYQKIAMVGFASTLEELSGTKLEYIDISEVWERDPPTEATTETMQSYMSDVSRNSPSKTSLTAKAPFRSWCYDYIHGFDDFRNDYRQKFHKKPFFEQTPETLW
jgi:hypothetical protein